MRTIFLGTPITAVPFLELLAKKTEVVAVVSQPDQPSGRKLEVKPTPVKAKALELGLKVLQPERPSLAAAELAALKPDLAVVVAYGRIVKKDILELPRLGCLNAHFSLLPKYRGAAPVQWALVHGETTTGVTLFWLDEGMDTGPIQAQEAAELGPDEDAPALLERLTALGVSLLERTLPDLEAGKVERRPQQGIPTMAPLIKREDAKLTWELSAERIHGKVRGFRGWPRAYLELEGHGRVLALKTALPGPSDPLGKGVPGAVLLVERTRGILIECGSRSRLWFLSVQPEGKNPVSAADFLNGLRFRPGDSLSLRA